MTMRQLVYLAVASVILGLAANTVSPNKIPFVGVYRQLSGSDSIVVPPAAQQGDPPYISLEVALLDFSGGKAIFVDAREEAEWKCGTIPGAINIPFDYLPEGDLGPYFDSALQYTSKDTPIVTFCSGEECDLSLYLGRNLQSLGYSGAKIFFGGAREWEKRGLEVERRAKCDN
jgi:rhodanese-related sulfurtransferase